MSIAVPLQEQKILEMLPFDRRVVQLYGSCTKGDNIQLVLEFMQVTTHQCKYPLFACVPLRGHQLSKLLLLSMLHAV